MYLVTFVLTRTYTANSTYINEYFENLPSKSEIEKHKNKLLKTYYYSTEKVACIAISKIADEKGK